jgi:hypothetical protein
LGKLEKGFLEAVTILKDYLPQIVIVGGWCPYLYARHLWKRKIPNIPTTLDIDVGVLETGSKHFETTVYEKLKSSGLALERLCAEEETPMEFIYKTKAVELKIDFITSFETSDDTLNRFLGSQLACNRIEAFELLLQKTLTVPIKIKMQTLSLRIPTPEIFLYHKGITFVMRSAEFKRDKDLFYVYFILKFHPDRRKLLETLTGFKKDDYFHAFSQNLREYLSETASSGYVILRSFLRSWMEESTINQEIRNTFSDILEIL